MPIRWVFVQDVQGTHRDECLYSTDPALTPMEIVSLFTGRWSIEVALQEVRTHLGLTAPRNWSTKSVLRTAPCLFGLFSAVSLNFAHHTEHYGHRPLSTPWYTKKQATFSDAITTVRRLRWETVLKRSPFHPGLFTEFVIDAANPFRSPMQTKGAGRCDHRSGGPPHA